MRILFVAILSLFFTSSFSFGEEKQAKDPDPKTFKEAYAGYQKYNDAQSFNEKHIKTIFAEKAYEFGLKKFGMDSINTANLMANLILSFADHSREHKEPSKIFEQSIERYKMANKDNPTAIIDLYKRMAFSFLKPNEHKKPKKALKYFASAIQLTDQYFGPKSLEQANLHLRIGTDLYNNHNTSKTRTYLKKALELYSSNPKTKKIDIAVSQFWYAKSLLSRKKTKTASKLLTNALETFEKEIPNHQYALAGHALMINILEKQGKSDEATKHCQAIGRVTPYTPDQDYLPVYKATPKYPYNAAVKNQQGYVLVEFTVDKEGFVKNPKAVEGSSVFFRSSLKAVQKFRYAPRFKDGKPVDTEGVRNLITYELAN